MRRRLTCSILILLALLFPIFLSGPIALYQHNSDEFTVGLLNMMRHLAPIGLPLLGLSLVLAFLPERIFTLVAGVLVGIAALFYIQGNFLVWHYGFFDGQGINWRQYWVRELVDGVAWMGGILLAVIYRREVVRRVLPIATILVGLQAANVLPPALNSETRWRTSQSEKLDQGLFQLSTGKNVIVLVLDSFLSPTFEKIASNTPEVKHWLRGFTYYRNTTSSFPTTAAAIPLLLTGKAFDNQEPLREFCTRNLPQSLPARLSRRGFQVDVVTLPQLCPALPVSSCQALSDVVRTDLVGGERAELSKLLDLTLFRHAPQPLKRLIYNNEDWFLQRYFGKLKGPMQQVDSVDFMQLMTAKLQVTATRPTYKFLHLLLPHPPSKFRRDCSLPASSNRASRRKKGEKGISSFEEQARCSLLLTERFLGKLKTAGAFDNSLVIVTADHGVRGGYLGKTFPAEIHGGREKALPLLLIKRPYEKTEFRVSEVPAELADLQPTIASHLGVPQEAPGTSIFDLNEDSPRERHFFAYSWRNRDWQAEYLPPMQEFLVNGHAWAPESWSKGKRRLEEPK